MSASASCPRPVAAHALRPGDVVVLGAGDTRQVHWATPTPSSAGLVSVDWGDGRHSLFDPGQVFTLLYEGQPPKSPPRVLDSTTDDSSLGGDSDSTASPGQ